MLSAPFGLDPPPCHPADLVFAYLRGVVYGLAERIEYLGMNATSRDRPVAVDVFSGAGGMSLGFEQAGFDVLAAVDSDPVHLAVHEHNFPHAYPQCADVASISVQDIEGAVRKGWALAGRSGEWGGSVDCLLGGPSCQGFSDMGRQRPGDPRNELIFAFARIVEDLQPRTFVMENVPGLLFPKTRDQLDRLVLRFRNAGYTIQSDPPACIDATDYGVPQRRRRVFLIGVAEGLPIPDPPKRTDSPTVSEALDDLPNVDEFPELLSTDRVVMTSEQQRSMQHAASEYAQSLRTRYQFEYPRRWDEAVLTGCRRTVHSRDVHDRFASLDSGGEDQPSRTKRLSPGGFAQTLRAGTGRDHGSFTAPRPIHHVYPRVITVREAARLHSFPDWFQFHVTKWHALREIGNAVPPRLAAAVARTVFAALGEESCEPPEQVLNPGSDALLEMSLRGAARHYGYDESLLPDDVRRKSAINRHAV